MSFLRIRNPGMADYRGFTLLGVSTTRNAGQSGTIGQFGSGSKLSVALLLRHGINPTITCGKLHMDFFTKEVLINGQTFHNVCVKYSGTDVDGTSKTSTEDLGFVTEMGLQDWTKPSMAFREFVSNGIDGSIVAGGSYKGVEFDVVEKPRGKFGYTSVFLPYTEEIEKLHLGLSALFLHFGSPELLKARCLPKRFPSEDKVLIYKKGVLVHHIPGKSVFDYNLGDELTLDESRNATEWQVKYAVAMALRNETPDNIAAILKEVIVNSEIWEAKLDADYLQSNTYATPEAQEKRKVAFKDAWAKVAGPKGVVTSGSVSLSSFVLEKGFHPVHVEGGWAKALESYDVLSETKVLTRNELEGKTLFAATPEMVDCTKKVWKLFEAFNLTNGKECPNVIGFNAIMDGGSQTGGYYLPGTSDIYLHTSLGMGKKMFKIALEECVHYTTGSTDGSRDIQDFLFNLVTDMAF